MGRDELLWLLEAEGALPDRAWRDAFAEVPRELFVPEYFVPGFAGYERRSGDAEDPAARRRWRDGLYEDLPLATRLRHGELISSSSQPSLMARMLDELAVRDGMTVLEIGTGTGWNAALLAHRLGAHRVTTLDLDPEITGAARTRLRRAGFPVTVVTTDGALGWPERAPYDRIIATCAVDTVPGAWLEQCASGARVLTPLSTGLVLLRVERGEEGPWAQGRFLDTAAFFVPLRGAAATAPGTPAATERRERDDGGVPGTAAGSDTFRFLRGLTASALSGREAYAVWERAGHPERSRYGVTADVHGAWAWLDEPRGPDRWRLPRSTGPAGGEGLRDGPGLSSDGPSESSRHRRAPGPPP
ncbi:methyltransferase domain-containing protein [Streptomyces sp. JJ38]|uniref:methyltransferase domain-containing protein n=1 Tax=Streptomyces sp. JJ38 TaxID=2738128 RepID=UPI001C55AE01|nr:methyltransferase domain-containing protein [Streptomyces sp. JJ38]MBW1599789.1 methyltransferase domain-containing protein [Streptomyces sp. JJ38]